MNKTIVKEYEAISAIEDGATEIDMVMNVGAFKDKDYDYVKQEIENILKSDNKIEVECHFCGEKYKFTKQDFEGAF